MGSKDNSQSVPNCLEGKVTHETILDKFRQCYQELYNSAGTEPAMFNIKEKIQALINPDDEHEVSKVTAEVVKEACGHMRRFPERQHFLVRASA